MKPYLALSAALTEVKAGVTGWLKQKLRDSHIWQEFLDEFKGGKVTIAVAHGGITVSILTPKHAQRACRKPPDLRAIGTAFT